MKIFIALWAAAVGLLIAGLSVRANQPISSVAGGSAVFTKTNENFNSGSANLSALAVNIGPSVAGRLFVVVLRGFNSGNTPMNGSTVTTTNGTACTHSTGAFKTQGSADLAPWSDIWYCMNNAASGSVTFNASYSSTGPLTGETNTPQMLVGEFSGGATTAADANITNTSSGASLGSPFSISTSAAVPQTNDLVISTVGVNTSGPTSYGPGQAAFVTDSSTSFSVLSSGTVTHTYNWSGTNTLASSIAAFKHP